MSMPNWEGFMVPALAVLSDGQTRNRRDLNDDVAAHLKLSPEDIGEILTSGQPKYANRIGWAVSYLANVGALTRPARGKYEITSAGRRLLTRCPADLKERDFVALTQDLTLGITPYKATTAVAKPASSSVFTDVEAVAAELDPTEQVEHGIARINEEVGAELLSRLLDKNPSFFEQAVVDLLVAMGYGGAEGRATVTKQSGDGGIDGIIDQDALGLSRVYIQAKRYSLDSTIGRPDLQGFVGALAGKADGGVFITTCRFTKEAIAYAEAVPNRLILIDGARLTDLMIRYGVGVQVRDTYRIVEIDEDFFE